MADFKQMFSSFQGSSKAIIGVDIGASSIKLSNLKKVRKGKYKLVNFAIVPLPEAAIIEEEIQKPDEVSGAILDALDNAGLKGTFNACIGVSGPSTVTKRFKVPSAGKEELEDNIRWEAEQYIPFEVDDSELDFHIISQDKKEDVVDVIIAAVNLNHVEVLKEVVNSSNLNLKIIDLTVFSLSNLMEECSSIPQKVLNEEGVIVIDFGAQFTKVIVYRNQAPVLTKEVPFGGLNVTEDLQKQMGVSFEDAEILKSSVDDNGNLPQEVESIIDNQIDYLIQEVKKIVSFYVVRGSSEQITRCLITGGGALTNSIIDKITNEMNLEVDFLNPLNKISVDSSIEKVYSLEEIVSLGSVSLGLALRGLHD